MSRSHGGYWEGASVALQPWHGFGHGHGSRGIDLGNDIPSTPSTVTPNPVPMEPVWHPPHGLAPNWTPIILINGLGNGWKLDMPAIKCTHSNQYCH